MAQAKYVFFIDIDGTLMNDGVICARNRRAIKYAREKGHYVFINTARSMAIIPEKIKKIPLDGFVTALGCCIYVNKEKIYSTAFPVDYMAEIYDYLTLRGRTVYIEGTDYLIKNSSDDKYTGWIYAGDGKTLREKFAYAEMPKVFIPDVLSDEECAALSEVNLYRHPGYTEFCVKGHDKATGIEMVMNHFGIDMKYSVAVGDSINDLEMLRAAGIAAVMQEAPAQVKKYADIITGPAKDGGVAEGILRVINGDI